MAIATLFKSTTQARNGIRLKPISAGFAQQMRKYTLSQRAILPRLIWAPLSLQQFVKGGVLHVANVGDSRAYLVRAKPFRQITRDHSGLQSKYGRVC